MLLKTGLISAFAFLQSAMMVAAGDGPPPQPAPPAASGDGGSDAALILVVLLGALLLAANGRMHGAAPLACDDADDNGECDDNAPQN